MNKQREKWWAENKDSLFSPDKMDFNKIWDAAIESTKEPKFGCHLERDEHESEEYTICHLDYKRIPSITSCQFADFLKRNGKSKSDCEFWRKIEG